MNTSKRIARNWSIRLDVPSVALVTGREGRGEARVDLNHTGVRKRKMSKSVSRRASCQVRQSQEGQAKPTYSHDQ